MVSWWQSNSLKQIRAMLAWLAWLRTCLLDVLDSACGSRGLVSNWSATSTSECDYPTIRNYEMGCCKRCKSLHVALFAVAGTITSLCSLVCNIRFNTSLMRSALLGSTAHFDPHPGEHRSFLIGDRHPTEGSFQAYDCLGDVIGDGVHLERVLFKGPPDSMGRLVKLDRP